MFVVVIMTTKRGGIEMTEISTDPLRYKLVKDLANIVSVFERSRGRGKQCNGYLKIAWDAAQ